MTFNNLVLYIWKENYLLSSQVASKDEIIFKLRFNASISRLILYQYCCFYNDWYNIFLFPFIHQLYGVVLPHQFTAETNLINYCF